MTNNTAISELKSSVASSHYNLLMHVLHGRSDAASNEYRELLSRRELLVQAREEAQTKLRDLDDTIAMVDSLIQSISVKVKDHGVSPTTE